MISLFIDTSLVSVSISVVKDNKILSLIQKDIPNMHSIYATSFVKKALDEAHINAFDIDNIYAKYIIDFIKIFTLRIDFWCWFLP